jgi:hypothetical protein
MDLIPPFQLYAIIYGVRSLLETLTTPELVKEYSTNGVDIKVSNEENLVESGIIDVLDALIEVCDIKKKSDHKTVYQVVEMCHSWRKHLAYMYPEKTRFGLNDNLDDANRKGMINDFTDLENKIIEKIKISDFILNLESNQTLDVSKKSLKILDKSAKADLDEGFELIQSGHTTSAYMIFMRVAEFLVQQYYKKITGYYPKNDDAAWGQMLFSLQNDYKSKIDKNFANLLYYLKDRRNEAQHPGKRFDEKDCNKLITYLTEYVDYFAKKK